MPRLEVGEMVRLLKPYRPKIKDFGEVQLNAGDFGKLFWFGPDNINKGRFRVGIDFDGARAFLPAEIVEPLS